MGQMDLLIRATWRNRRETAVEGAVRLAELLRLISAVHPDLGLWYKQTKRKPSLEPFCSMPPDPKELEGVLARGVQYRDLPREPWPELGLSAGAWNGAGPGAAAASFRITIGAYDTDAAGHNRFELNVAADEFDPLLSPEAVRDIVKAAIVSLDPDCMDVAPMTWLVTMDEATCPAGGWMSYVRDFSAYQVQPPADALVEPVGPGVLLRSTEEPFAPAIARALNKALAPVRLAQARPVAPAHAP